MPYHYARHPYPAAKIGCVKLKYLLHSSFISTYLTPSSPLFSIYTACMNDCYFIIENQIKIEMESYFSHDPRSYDMARRSVKDKKGGGKRGKAVKLSTDAQSVAARERRHRISERFKILQSLVPGGSKMDTVSMLEEAIHYVKFLKAQIWLHQTMINCVDTDPSLFPFQTYLPVKSSSADNLYSQVVNMNGEVEAAFAGPSQQPGFAYSAGLQFEDNIPLLDDATLLY